MNNQEKLENKYINVKIQMDKRQSKLYPVRSTVDLTQVMSETPNKPTENLQESIKKRISEVRSQLFNKSKPREE